MPNTPEETVPEPTTVTYPRAPLKSEGVGTCTHSWIDPETLGVYLCYQGQSPDSRYQGWCRDCGALWTGGRTLYPTFWTGE